LISKATAANPKSPSLISSSYHTNFKTTGIAHSQPPVSDLESTSIELLFHK
jgi:hypothetical protein